jgi:hypothetical protein
MKTIMKTRRINELQNLIRKSEEEIKSIRAACKHEDGYEVLMYSWRVGAIHPQRICNVCQGVISGITAEETKRCLDESV